MTRTSYVALIVLGLLGVVFGWLAEILLVQNGLPLLQLHPVYSITVVLLGTALFLLAMMVFRSVRSDKPTQLNPLWAAFLLQLIQASILAASLLTGFAIGSWLWMFSQYALPASIIWTHFFGIIATLVLLILAMIAEKLCEVPPEDSEPGGTTGLESSS